MENKPVALHRLARNEAAAAVRWYQKRSQQAAGRFSDELQQALMQIAERPESFPEHLLGTRRVLLRRFPYLVIYRELPEFWLVVAVAHGRRRPGYWRRRV